MTPRPEWLTIPNVITVVRLLLVVPISVLLLTDGDPGLTAALLAGFGLSDWVDGFLARRLGQTSRVGKIIDPVADRLGVVVITLVLVVSGHLPAWMVLLVGGTDLLLSVLFLTRRGAAIPSVTRLGKVRTAFLMTGLALVAIGRIPALGPAAPAGVVAAGVGAVLHVLAGIGYARVILRSASG